MISLLQKNAVDLTTVDGLTVPERVFGVYDLDSLNPISLLFQTGYLTIKELVSGDIFRLGYPNKEVRAGFLNRLTASELERAGARDLMPMYQLGLHLESGDFQAFFEIVTGLFASIPYEQAARLNEANFHALFYLMLTMAGIESRAELLTNKGRIDLALEEKERVTIFEFKCGQSAEAGVAQIKEKGYAERWEGSGKAVRAVGVGFDAETRNLSGWKLEEVEV